MDRKETDHDRDIEVERGYYTLSAVAAAHTNLPGKVRRNAPNPVAAAPLADARKSLDRSSRHRWDR